MTIRANVKPNNPSRAEIELARIASLLSDDWLVWMNRHLNFDYSETGSMDREVDCIFYHRKHGLLVVECKSGKIATSRSSRDGEIVWLQSGKPMDKKPRDQVEGLIAPLHEYMKHLLRSPEDKDFYRVRVQWAVCFSDMDNLMNIPLAEIPRKRALLRPDLLDVKHFEKRLIEILEIPAEARNGRAFVNDYLDEEAFFALQNFLDGNGERVEESDLLREDNFYSEQATEMQQMMMESISRNPRMRIEGVAGSGKSRMVVWEALRLSRIGKSVAIVCYNDLLADELQSDMNEVLERDRAAVIAKYGKDGGVSFAPVEVHAYSEWCKKYAKAVKILPKMGKDAAQYYDKDLPHALKQATKMMRKDKKMREKFFFDAVIIDEGQDFACEWIDSLTELLRDSERGIIRFFYDPAQRLFGARNGIDCELVNKMPVMVLNRGFRNTCKILDWVYKNTGIRVQCYNNTPQGKSVKELRYTNPAEQEKLLVECYENLVSHYKLSYSDILVVSMCSERTSGIRNIKDERFVWNRVGGKKLIRDKVNIVSTYRIKGLDALAVILVDVEEPAELSKRENWKRCLLVGATRAKQLLSVIRKK